MAMEDFYRLIEECNVLITCLVFIGLLLSVFLWFHLTNPYAHLHIVQQPYTTSVAKNGTIDLRKHFTVKSHSSKFAQGIGYIKSGFLIVQNAWFGSYRAPSHQADDIIQDIHRIRFDPDKPYLISGDQFSVLYPRNLGVFYNSLLNPATAHNQQDWENRQRVYLQSAVYAVDAFAQEKTLTTTIVPLGARRAVLTQVHPGSVPSDTLYGILFALQSLQDEERYPHHPTYKLQTIAAAQKFTANRRDDLSLLLDIYINQVRDPSTGLVRRNIDLASARDGVVRESSFYDNVVLWKTLSLANDLQIRHMPATELEALRQKILTQFWDEQAGHFKDDLSERPASQNYSSDWLLALPTGFLSIKNQSDQRYLHRSIAFIRKHGIAEPLPIKYTASNQHVAAPWAVKTFVPNYGGDAIWSYWGAQYITLLGQLGTVTSDSSYQDEARRHIATYRQKMEEYQGYPETFAPDGTFLQNPVYKSIRQTGWVVQFEEALQSVQ